MMAQRRVSILKGIVLDRRRNTKIHQSSNEVLKNKSINKNMKWIMRSQKYKVSNTNHRWENRS